MPDAADGRVMKGFRDRLKSRESGQSTVVIVLALTVILGAAALVVDLASKPGGVDFAAARELGRRVEWALSLPAKTAPRAAAGYVRDSLYQIMEECT